MAFTRIHHVGMVTSDLEMARNLFCNGFGLSVDEHRTPWPGDESSGPVTSVEFPIGKIRILTNGVNCQQILPTIEAENLLHRRDVLQGKQAQQLQ